MLLKLHDLYIKQDGDKTYSAQSNVIIVVFLMQVHSTFGFNVRISMYLFSPLDLTRTGYSCCILKMAPGVRPLYVTPMYIYTASCQGRSSYTWVMIAHMEPSAIFNPPSWYGSCLRPTASISASFLILYCGFVNCFFFLFATATGGYE